MSEDSLIGKVLGNRYELIEKIGTGGMATVYKARCRLLNRYVAVKILKEELRTDQEFVRKFNAESQAAAKLSHHNIVSIYDVGEEDGINYIVMEYVDGITLKEYIRRKGAIGWQEACRFALQICAALEHAHAKHIVHRDIKPHNILMTHDMTLKVTDFGIARAVSSDTVVAGSATFGSVHYISPEQARGGYTDERSDLYSCGIVLYEMLTGRVPFDGENPVSVALMHLEKQAEDVRLVNPEVPEAVAEVVMKAISKEQHARYQTAAQMTAEIKQAMAQSVFSSDTMSGATQPIPAVSAAKSIRTKKGKREKKPKTPQQKKEDKLALILGASTIGLVLLIAIGTYVFMTWGSHEVQVPDLTNRTLEEAQMLVEEVGMKIDEPVELVASDEVEEGHVISQDPGANQYAKKRVKIKLVVSSGKGTGNIETPDVVNLNYKDAIKQLQAEELSYEIIDVEDTSVSSNVVVKQIPTSGTKVNKGDKIKLYVSTGEGEKTSVPSVLGQTQDKAERSILKAGFRLGSVTREHSDSPAGTVIRQNPSGGSSATKNSFVSVVLSEGPEQTSTPEPTNTPEPTKEPTARPSAEPKKKTVKITIPDSAPDRVQIKVVAGGKVIHNQAHDKTEKTISLTLSGTKDTELEIYMDNELVETRTVSFD
jgi:serine/threonine protein kinase/beta-lactam-binding protein with PASTA domain